MKPPRFAAMTLVPEGWFWQVGQGNHAWAAVYENPIPPSMRVDPIAATPALALCAAALRARAAEAVKVDEKMIEATMLTDEAAFQLGNHVLGLCGVTKSRRAGVTELGRQVYRAAMLSAAPTDYAELVSHVRRYAGELYT